jgi:hypothetical protein
MELSRKDTFLISGLFNHFCSEEEKPKMVRTYLYQWDAARKISQWTMHEDSALKISVNPTALLHDVGQSLGSWEKEMLAPNPDTIQMMCVTETITFTKEKE